jgi:predicted AAA+ superfamily ATPase
MARALLLGTNDLVRSVCLRFRVKKLVFGKKRQRAWARDYIRAIVERDIRDIADLEKLAQVPRLLQLLARHSGQLTNFSQLGGQIGVDDKTAMKYQACLRSP